MSYPPPEPICSFAEAKAAIDEQIADLQNSVNYYERGVEKAKADLSRHETALWRLKSLRSRMDPPAKPELAVVEQVPA